MATTLQEQLQLALRDRYVLERELARIGVSRQRVQQPSSLAHRERAIDEG